MFDRSARISETTFTGERDGDEVITLGGGEAFEGTISGNGKPTHCRKVNNEQKARARMNDANGTLKVDIAKIPMTRFLLCELLAQLAGLDGPVTSYSLC